MILVGPVEPGKPGLMGRPEASPDSVKGPDRKLSDLFLTMLRGR